MSKNSILIINGQRYNTSDSSDSSLATSLVASVSDDRQHARLTAVASPQSITPAPRSHRQTKRRQAAQYASAHTPNRSQTLMRQAVKKPAATGLTRPLSAHSCLDITPQRTLSAITIKSSVTTLDPNRVRHASRTPKSQAVSHFASSLFNNSGGRYPQPVTFTTTTGISTTSLQPTGRPLSSAPRRTVSHRRKPRTTAELLEYALEHATSHEQLPPPRKRSHNPLRRVSRSFSVR